MLGLTSWGFLIPLSWILNAREILNSKTLRCLIIILNPLLLLYYEIHDNKIIFIVVVIVIVNTNTWALGLEQNMVVLIASRCQQEDIWIIQMFEYIAGFDCTHI